MAGVNQIVGRALLGRDVSANVLAADVPLSFWGGFDPDRGEIIDRRHPLSGEIAIGRVLVIPHGRGSCSGSGVLLESIQNGTAPAAIITSQIDPIITLGAVLGDELYGTFPAIILVTEEDRLRIVTGDNIHVNKEGTITLVRPSDDGLSHRSIAGPA